MTPAVRRVLDRVVDQVAEDLPQLLRIGRDGSGRRRPSPTSISTCGGRCARAASIVRSRATAASQLSISKVSCWESSRLASSTSFDDPRQPVSLARDHAEQARTLLAARASSSRSISVTRGAVHRRERRPQLVRDRGDEVAAHLLQRALLGQVAECVHRPLGQADAGDRKPQLAAAALDRQRLGAPCGRAPAAGRRGSAPRAPPSPG